LQEKRADYSALICFKVVSGFFNTPCVTALSANNKKWVIFYNVLIHHVLQYYL